MRVFLLSPETAADGTVEIGGEAHHYLSRVLRLKGGDQFPGTDGAGTVWRLRLMRVGPRSLTVRLEEPRVQPEPLPAIELLQALPKGAKMDLIVRQATEAGASRLRPLVTAYTVARPSEGRARRQRWLRIAREALQQCGGLRLPQIDAPVTLKELLAEQGEPGAGEVRLVFHQERVAGATLHGLLARRPRRLLLAVGPEGGFAAEEVEALRGRGYAPVLLGAAVLRAETAALYALAAVRTVMEERESWKPA